jgi:hypothetical protein
VGGVQPGRGEGFAAEPLLKLRIVAEMRRQHLNRHDPVGDHGQRPYRRVALVELAHGAIQDAAARGTVFPLPAPPQDPITLLSGHGYEESTGSACVGGDFDEKCVRTGD